VSGGSYHDATDAEGLLRALEEALEAAIVETVLRVELEVPDGTRHSATVHLCEAGTDHLVSDYAAWKDNVVPPGDYDRVVDTLPKLVYEGLTLPEGSTTVLRIILSAIRVLTSDGREDTSVDILDANGERLDFGYGGTFELVPGTYQLGVNDTRSQPITLSAGDALEFRLAVIQVAGSFELADIAGNRLGLSRRDSALVVPGTYMVRLEDGTVVENVVAEAGQVAEVK